MIVRSPAFLRLGLERPGLQKSSISFEFLLKIDDFRRRVDSEKPGVEKPSIFKRNSKEIDDFWRPGLSRPSRREAGDRKIIDLQRIPFENGKKPMKSKQKRDTFHDSRLKTRKNAIHSTNCSKKTRKTRAFWWAGILFTS